jgi:hypothetical protein
MQVNDIVTPVDAAHRYANWPCRVIRVEDIDFVRECGTRIQYTCVTVAPLSNWPIPHIAMEIEGFRPRPDLAASLDASWLRS